MCVSVCACACVPVCFLVFAISQLPHLLLETWALSRCLWRAKISLDRICLRVCVLPKPSPQSYLSKFWSTLKAATVTCQCARTHTLWFLTTFAISALHVRCFLVHLGGFFHLHYTEGNRHFINASQAGWSNRRTHFPLPPPGEKKSVSFLSKAKMILIIFQSVQEAG